MAGGARLFRIVVVGLAMVAHGGAADAREAREPIVRSAADADVRLTVELDRSTLMIDDSLRLSITVEAPEDYPIDFPDIRDSLGRLVVAGQRAEEPAIEDGTATRKHLYVLQPEGVGELTLPPVAITWRRGADAAPERLGVNATVVTVRSVLPDDADVFRPKGIAPPVEMRATGPPGWLWPGAAALVAILAAGWLAWRRHRRRARSGDRLRPAHLVALEELERLRRDELVTRGRIEEFYVRLSAILRHYAASRFGLKAPSRTTEEFLGELRTLDAPVTAHRASIEALLTDADLAKFARRRPADEAVRTALDAARDVVERTGDPDVVVDGGLGEPALRSF